MRKLIIGFCILILASSCRKGDDDPYISLRKRKTRICKNWEIESGYVEWNNGIGKGKYTVIENVMNTNYNNGMHFVADYKLNITIKENNTYIYEYEIVCADTVQNEYYYAEGIWEFLAKNSENKNKEQIVFFPDKITRKYHNQNLTTIIENQSSGEIWHIDGLWNRKLMISTRTLGYNGIFRNYNYTMTCNK